MESVPPNDMNLTDDPEGGCIVQADDPQMTAFDGAALAENNSCYWTSMLKLMEQGSTHIPISSCMSTTNSTHNINNNLYTPGAPSMPAGQQAQQATEDLTPPPSISSPSSSSVHDQPLDMVTQNNALNIASDPDNSVWGQEFLSGPIGENKTSSTIACSDDGLHELLYPRTVLELLFSDQLKLEQMPSWPDILQTHGTNSGKSFGFPLPSADRSSCEAGMMSVTGHDNVSMDNPQGHMKFTQYLHSYSPLSGIDDHLSSSATSSSLSDNAIDQWAVPSSGTQCGAAADDMRALTETTIAQSSPLSSNNMHHRMDHIRVKEEYSHVASPTFVSNNIDHGHGCNNYQSQPIPHELHSHNQRIIGNNNMQINAGGINGLQESMNEYEQKPNLLSKLWNPGVFHTNDLLAHINHKQHIYESITAANFSHNLRQLAGLQTSAVNGYCNVQSFNNNNTNAVGINSGPPALQSSYLNQLPQPAQLAKKSRSFHDVVGGSGAASRIIRGGAHDPDQLMIRKDEGNSMTLQQAEHAAMMMEDDSKPNIANNVGAAAAGTMHTLQRQQQQQLSSSEYNSNSNLNKRCRIDQQQAGAGASCTSTSASTAASTSTNRSTSSSSAFKNQPVRKEKLSERIATLQQLVSPFGKTDTASVLLEAIGYIKFLQEQVQQALSSPYFKSPITQNGDICQGGEESKPDLRSRGLCLVPLSCTLQVANDNGADYWYGGSFR
ncbi:hypothetical protein L7F22_009152 [Adiantum nelumboides]|nr:hypothetical protein [Adiantum nelumboides]